MCKKCSNEMKLDVNKFYGLQALSCGIDSYKNANLKSAKTISKIIANRAGFLYADTDGTYVMGLDKKL